jgi:hypothetical protein
MQAKLKAKGYSTYVPYYWLLKGVYYGKK